MRQRATYRGQTASSLWAPLFVIGMTLVASVAAAAQQGRTWDFERDRAGEAPTDFSFARTGAGRAGRWVVRAEQDAPSGAHVLTQLDDDATDFRFPMAVANEPRFRDLRLAVKCKAVAGQVDQACGLVFRYQDDNNYYVTRANALEGNVRLYRVVNGNRQQLAGWNGAVASGVWHALVVEARGDRFTVYWDGQDIINAHDQSFLTPGHVGVWTKADSITDFDDLMVEPLDSSP